MKSALALGVSILAIGLVASPGFAQNAPKGAAGAPAAAEGGGGAGGGAMPERPPAGGGTPAGGEARPAPGGGPAQHAQPVQGQPAGQRPEAQPGRQTNAPEGQRPAPQGQRPEPQGQRPEQKGEAPGGKPGGGPAAASGNAQPGANAQGRAPRPAPHITEVQRTRVRDSFRHVDVHPIHVNFAIDVGVAVPRTVVLAPVPTEVISVVPDYEGFEYFVVPGQIVIVDPDTLDIVAVLPL